MTNFKRERVVMRRSIEVFDCNTNQKMQNDVVQCN